MKYVAARHLKILKSNEYIEHKTCRMCYADSTAITVFILMENYGTYNYFPKTNEVYNSRPQSGDAILKKTMIYLENYID